MIKFYLNRKLFLSAFLGALIFFTSCDSEENPAGSGTSVLDTVSYTVQIRSVADVAQNGNASDIKVVFLGATANDEISEYRLLVAKLSVSQEDILEGISEMNASSYTSASSMEGTITITLDEQQTDFSGEPITNEISYKVWVLSIGEFNGARFSILSEPSAEFVLEEEASVVTLASMVSGIDALSVDREGNVYASHYGVWGADGSGGDGTKLFKITPEGVVSEEVSSGLDGPVGNIVDEEGNHYIVDGSTVIPGGGQLVKIATDGSKTVIATLEGYPTGVISDDSHNFYVANYTKGIVNKVTLGGTVTKFAEDSDLLGCAGIDIDEDGNLVVANFNNGKIFSIDSKGEVSLIVEVERSQHSDGSIGYITCYDNFIYATGINKHEIYKISLAGEIALYAGNGAANDNDGPLSAASFIRPNGITVDKQNGILYFYSEFFLKMIDLSDD